MSAVSRHEDRQKENQKDERTENAGQNVMVKMQDCKMRARKMENQPPEDDYFIRLAGNL